MSELSSERHRGQVFILHTFIVLSTFEIFLSKFLCILFKFWGKLTNYQKDTDTTDLVKMILVLTFLLN